MSKKRSTSHSAWYTVGMETTTTNFDRNLDICLDAMEKHGLLGQGWDFTISKTKNIIADCNDVKDVIRMSRMHLELGGEYEVKQVILHEIAHALVGTGYGHNHKWRAKAWEIGVVDPSSTFSVSYDIPHKIEIVCSVCNGVLAKRQRRMNATKLKGSWCMNCGKTSKGLLYQVGV
jgi:predicted SprT family Zn-dependent metalloprotease